MPAQKPAVAEISAAPRQPAHRLANAAARLAARLSPVSRAEAAPVPRPEPIPAARFARQAPAAPGGWSIQLGAFRDQGAARQAARTADSLRFVRGKPLEILPPIGRARARLYRARLLRFTAKDAESACAALRKRRIPCAVVPPVRLARR
jgi:D-alanyl-D-alanine carboxypeptidase